GAERALGGGVLPGRGDQTGSRRGADRAAAGRGPGVAGAADAPTRCFRAAGRPTRAGSGRSPARCPRFAQLRLITLSDGRRADTPAYDGNAPPPNTRGLP